MNTILRNVLEVSKNGEVWEKYDNFDLNKTSLIFAYKHNIFLGKVRSAKFVIFITAFFILFIFSYSNLNLKSTFFKVHHGVSYIETPWIGYYFISKWPLWCPEVPIRVWKWSVKRYDGDFCEFRCLGIK